MYKDYRIKQDNDTGLVSIYDLNSEKTVVSEAESRVEATEQLAEYFAENIPAEPDRDD